MAIEPEVNADVVLPGTEAIPEVPAEEEPDEETNIPALLLAKIDACKHLKRELVPEWTKNIDYRRGKNDMSDSDDSRNPQAVDWAYTKTKQTQLHSKTPQVFVGYEGAGDSPYKLVLPVFQKQLNKRIRDAKVAIAMDEVVPDAVNASGVAALLVSFEARSEQRMVPKFDEAKLTMVQKIQQRMGLFVNPEVPMTQVTDRKFSCRRISSPDLIWDTASPTSDFDEHALLGYTGRVSKAEAKRRWPNLTPEEIEKASGDDRNDTERFTSKDNHRKDDDCVTYDEVFYYRYKYHPEEPSFKAIQNVVFLKGRKIPIVNAPWKGQEMLPDGSYIGACKLPVRVATLTYISDEPIPPSDSAMARPMVDELIEYRQDQKLQRKHSVPVRWADATRVPSESLQRLMEGDYQSIVLTNGNGDKAIGEIARASYPRDNDSMERMVKQDLRETYKAGPAQAGASSSGDTATEAEIVQENFASEIGYERARMTGLFLGAVEVLAGLVLLYDDFNMAANLSDTDKQRVQGLDLRQIPDTVFTIRPDSTVLLDAEQEYKRLNRFLDVSAKSGYSNPKPVLERMAALSQLDPAEVIKDPTPNAPDQPNVSFRFSGEDLLGPMANIILAIMAKAGQCPTPQELEAVMKMRQAAGLNPMNVQPSVNDGAPIPEEMPDNPNPQWGMNDRLNKRNAERSAQ